MALFTLLRYNMGIREHIGLPAVVPDALCMVRGYRVSGRVPRGALRKGPGLMAMGEGGGVGQAVA